jgi:transcription antitermination factor NusG
LFARFEPATWAHRIDCAPGVHGIVRFGAHCPTVPEGVIQNLSATVGPEQVHVIDETPAPGEAVRLAGGAFHGLEAVVTRVMPGRERVVVLLEFLGRQTKVEVATANVVRLEGERRLVVGQPFQAAG